MKAARLVGPRQFEILDVDTPSPKPGEALVKLETLSICGSDLLTYDRVFAEEDYPRPAGLPCHETSGVVVESLDESLKPGERVVALTYSGGLFEYVAMPAARCIPVPESVPAHLAVLAQPVGTVIYAVQKMGSVLGKTVVVLGQGPIGLTFTDLIARALTVAAARVDEAHEVCDLLSGDVAVRRGLCGAGPCKNDRRGGT